MTGIGVATGLFLAAPAGIVSSSGLPATAGGAISGQFATTPTGAATFSVPIQVPPGIQGLQPSLGLVYNSQSVHNGLTGVGWQLSGLPGIERCGKRRSIDGVATGVTFTNADRLCMNGVPLVSRQSIANDNDYWSQSGRTYGKELEDRVSIRPAHGIANGGPWELQATLPDGRIMYYGGHTGARIRSANGNQKVRQWLLRMIRDRNGNSIHYTYAHDWGHARISRIDYAGRSIQFDYTETGARDHVIRSTGNEIKRIRHRLDRIRISTAEAPAYKSYHLSYGLSNSSSRSRLERIEECDPNRCLDPLELTWNDTPPLNGSFRRVHTPGYQYQLWLRSDFGVNIIPGDFNGDGKTDFIRQTKNGWDDTVYTGNFMVWFSNGDGTFNYVFPEDNGNYQDLLRHDPGARLITGDYNGDGKTDFIRMPHNNWGPFRVYFSRGDGYFDIETTSNSAHQAWLRDDRANYYTGDFNGDGKTDFLRQEKGAWDDTINWGNFLVFFSNGDGTFNHVHPGTVAYGDKFQDWLRADPGALLIVGDYNGDGMSDFVRQEHSAWDDDTSNTFMVYFSKGNGDFDIVTPPNQAHNQATGAYTYQESMRFDSGANLIPGDFNGDGKTDLIRQEKGGWGEDGVNTVQALLSLGNGLFSVVIQNEPIMQSFLRPEFTHQIIPLDYNGDGRMDFIRQEVGGPLAFLSKLYVYVSRGDGYFDAMAQPGQNIVVPHQYGVNIIPGDYDGDGRSDFISQDHSAWDDDLDDNFRVHFAGLTANSAPVETIARIQQDTVAHDMTYRRLSEYDLHDENPQLNTSLRRMEGGTLPVIRTYSRTVPTAVESGAANQVINRSYDFKNPFMSTEARGFLGFSKLTINAPEEGERITERYHTRFPFTGKLLNRHTASYATGQPISFVDHTWQGAATATNATDHGYVYALQIVRTERLNYVNSSGNSYQQISSDFQYDSLGNPVLVTDTDGARTLQTCSTYANNTAAGRPGPLTGAIQGTGCVASGNSCSCSNRLKEFRVTHDGKGNVIEREDYDDSRNTWLTTTYGYDSRGNRNRTTTPTGVVETTTYESTFNTYPQTITTSADGKSFTETRKYDARHGTPTEEVDSNGSVRRVSYDNFGRPLTIHRTGPQGLVLFESHSYQRQGDHYVDLSQTRPSWNSATMTPGTEVTDGLGRVIRQDFGSGNDQRKVISIYNARSELVRKSIPYKSGINPGWTVYTYDDRHQVSAISHPTGAATTLTRSTGGLCANHQQRLEIYTTNTGGGQPRKQTECKNSRDRTEKLVLTDVATGASTTQTMTRDALGRLVGVSDGQTSTTIELDSLGRRTRVTSSDRGLVEYEYNAQGLLDKEIHNGESKTITHDGFGRTTEMVFHDGSRNTFEYDNAAFAGAQARMTAAVMVAANGSETSRREYSYDPEGNPSVVRLILDGGSGGTHVMNYNTGPHGQPERVQYPSGRLVCYDYDAVGDLIQIKGATGDCSQPTTEVFAAYSDYTKQGQPGRIAYGNGVTTDFTYDSLNRVQSIRTTDSDNTAILDQQYSWTALNEVDTVDDQLGTNDTDYTYNGFGYLKRAVGPYGDLSYEYGSGGNLTRKGNLNLTYSGSRPTAGDNGLALTYDSHGNVVERDNGNGDVYTLDYNGQYQIRQVAKNGVLAGRYEYDAGGDRVRKVDGNGNETIYVNRELEITRFAGGNILRTEYIQSPGGRIAAISTGEDPLAMIHGTSGTHAMQAQMYDATGSVSGLAGFMSHTTMAYVRNPTAASVAIVVFWALLFAAMLTAMIVYLTGKAGAYERRRRRMLWPAPVLVATFLSMSIQCGSNAGEKVYPIAPPGSDLFAFNFLLGPGGNGYGYPEEGTFYFQYNQVGSTSLVTDAAGKQAALTVYKPYGEIHQDASDGRDIFRGKFNNNEYDRDAEMYFFNARYYDASIGSFLQADSLTFGTNGNHAAALNRYAFSGNNPVTYSDPGGNLFWFLAPVAAAIYAVATSAAATAIIVGAVTGAAISGLAYGIEAAITGEGSWEGFGIAVGIGAAAGAIGGIVAAGAKAILGAVNSLLSVGRQLTEKTIHVVSNISGATFEGFSRSLITQQVENGTINWANVLIDTVMAAGMSKFKLRKFSTKPNIVGKAMPYNKYIDDALEMVPASIVPTGSILNRARATFRSYAPDILFGAVFKRGHGESIYGRFANGSMF